jgi:hypothetical protein
LFSSLITNSFRRQPLAFRLQQFRLKHAPAKPSIGETGNGFKRAKGLAGIRGGETPRNVPDPHPAWLATVDEGEMTAPE